MTWTVEFTPRAQKDLRALDKAARKRIEIAILKRLLLDPRRHLVPLAGDLHGYCKFRVGQYRLLCVREEEILRILVVKVAHRGSVYRR